MNPNWPSSTVTVIALEPRTAGLVVSLPTLLLGLTLFVFIVVSWRYLRIVRKGWRPQDVCSELRAI